MDIKIILNAVERTLNRIQTGFNQLFNYGSDSWSFHITKNDTLGFVIRIGTKDDEWYEKYYTFTSFDISQMVIEIMELLYGIKEDMLPLEWKEI